MEFTFVIRCTFRASELWPIKNLLRNSKLGVWSLNLPDLVDLNHAVMPLFKHPLIHKKDKQTHVTWVMLAHMHTYIHMHK